MVFLFPVPDALRLSGVRKCLFRPLPHLSTALLLFCCFFLVSVVELLILEAQPDLGFGISIKCLWVLHDVQKQWYIVEQLCQSLGSVSQEVSGKSILFFPVRASSHLSMHLVWRCYLKPGWAFKASGLIDIMKALTEILSGTLGKSSVFVAMVGLINTVPWKTSMGRQLMPALGGGQ